MSRERCDGDPNAGGGGRRPAAWAGDAEESTCTLAGGNGDALGAGGVEGLAGASGDDRT